MTDLLSLYRTMVRIRAFEDAAEAASQGGVSWGGAATGGGEVRVKGPLNATTTGLHLTADIPDPDPWWRLTHPLELFGLVD